MISDLFRRGIKKKIALPLLAALSACLARKGVSGNNDPGCNPRYKPVRTRLLEWVGKDFPRAVGCVPRTHRRDGVIRDHALLC